MSMIGRKHRPRPPPERALFFAEPVLDLKRLLKTITRHEIAVLTPDRQEELREWLGDLDRELNRVRSLLGIAIEGQVI